jgi:hypothetical protein
VEQRRMHLLEYALTDDVLERRAVRPWNVVIG